MSPIASFYIPGPDEDQFLKAYSKALENKEVIHLTEKHRDVAPILIDLDFRYPNESKYLSRQYEIQSIKDFIKVYLREISKYVDEKQFEVYIMEKSKPVQYERKNVIKDGVHIVIPNIVTNLSLQLMLREQLLSKLSFIEDEAKCINKIDDIFDKAVIDKNNWMMYGSCKPYNEPYLITNHITFNINDDNEITEHNNRIDKDKPWLYTETLSIRNKDEESYLP